MKNRIFVLSFSVLLISVLLVSFTYVKFFQDERMALIDQELQLLASSLLANKIETRQLEQIGELVADSLGEDRLLTVVSLYDPRGRVLYRNENGIILFGRETLPLDPERFSFERGPHKLRFLNFRLLPSHQFLQVGFILDKGEIRWEKMTKSAGLYVTVIFLILLVASYLLSRQLTKPLRSLAFYLERLTHSIAEGKNLPEVPNSFVRMQKVDDFSRLAHTVHSLGMRLQSSFAISQSTAAQMAHELKTPLTVIRNQLERMRNSSLNPESQKALDEGLQEVEHLSEVISAFLEWASLANDPKDQLFAVKVRGSLEAVISGLSKIYPSERIRLEEKSPLVLFGREEFVVQAFRNLIENALKYSPGLVIVVIESDGVTIQDEGPGIPESVLSRLGQPFNSGPRVPGVRSTGLGLAWVKALCERYGWSLVIGRVANKTQIKIKVPEEA